MRVNSIVKYFLLKKKAGTLHTTLLRATSRAGVLKVWFGERWGPQSQIYFHNNTKILFDLSFTSQCLMNIQWDFSEVT